MKQLFRIIDDTTLGEAFVVADNIVDAINIFHEEKIKENGAHRLSFIKNVDVIVSDNNENRLYM